MATVRADAVPFVRCCPSEGPLTSPKTTKLTVQPWESRALAPNLVPPDCPHSQPTALLSIPHTGRKTRAISRDSLKRWHLPRSRHLRDRPPSSFQLTTPKGLPSFHLSPSVCPLQPGSHGPCKNVLLCVTETEASILQQTLRVLWAQPYPFCGGEVLPAPPACSASPHTQGPAGCLSLGSCCLSFRSQLQHHFQREASRILQEPPPPPSLLARPSEHHQVAATAGTLCRCTW